MLQSIFEKLINMNITVNIGPVKTAYQGNSDCPPQRTKAAIQYEGHEEH